MLSESCVDCSHANLVAEASPASMVTLKLVLEEGRFQSLPAKGTSLTGTVRAAVVGPSRVTV